ncbi:MAG: hypothetical protein B6U97_02500 [Candidatus Altiarchaeales archaeon ex4484_96]|nr:MAG: hypothetical protein B6U97_02500 [Candidatus Altiarchaeales archaeon ex4484_96]
MRAANAFVLLIVYCAAYCVNATDVALVVSFPGNYSYLECVSVPENADGFDLLSKSTLNVVWGYDNTRGHYPLSMLGHECPENGCLLYSIRGAEWIRKLYFDGGVSCSQHYCAVQGDSVSLVYEGEPVLFDYQNICLGVKPEKTKTMLTGKITAPKVSDTPVIASIILIALMFVYFVYRYW